MNKLLLWLALPLLVLTSQACGAGRRVAKGDKLEKVSADYVLKQLVGNQVQADWMDARANIDFSGESLSAGGNAIIRLRRDSVIWISVRKLGFEVARAQITPDSVYILDRLNNEYAVEPLSYVENRYRLPARFDLLQQVLLGNPVFFTKELDVQPDESHYLLAGETNRWQTGYWVTPGSFRLQRMRLAETAQQRQLDLTLDKYQAVAGNKQDFSYFRKLALDSQETGRAEVTIEFTKVELNAPTEIRFDIPGHYTRSK